MSDTDEVQGKTDFSCKITMTATAENKDKYF
jgi:hypothetical protein